MNILIFSLALVAGFVLLVKGSDYFVDGAAAVASKLGIPQLIIGLTIVAMGTSAPEAAVSIAAAFQGDADITIGNILGSNILNTLIILGLSATIVSIAVAASTVKYELPFMIICSALLLFLGLDGQVSLMDGIILWVVFVIYMLYLFAQAKNNTEDAEEIKELKWYIQAMFIIGGVAAIIGGSKLAVYGATGIATMMGVSQRFIGLTIVALGTSLPELFTSVTAARKGNADIAVGNIVGSNLFNILFVVGTTALVTVVPYDKRFMVDSFVMIGAAILTFILVLPKKRIGRAGGIMMLLGYVGYFIYLCVG